ncbi:MAG TPA: sulfurtransferase [Burkholderiaceae bacterium]|nr:sulfurtransferase [Burkholderiaceae bacterium]
MTRPRPAPIDAPDASGVPGHDASASGTARRGALRRLVGLGAASAALAASACATRTAVDPATVPEPKRTRAGLYLSAAEVPGFIASHGGAARVLFLDVRTRAEAMYVGMPAGVDALVPFVEHQELMTDWDDRRGMYRLEPLQDFGPEPDRRRGAKGLAKTDPVVLICRSGDRSSRGADRLAADGYARVWSVVDGFEGDMGGDGRRSVNGWKNAGLPWSYRLDRARMYFQR